MVTRGAPRPASAEQRLKELGINLPAPPEPFGTYAEAVQTGNLLFLTGMLPTEGRGAKFVGRVGAELDVEAGREAAHLAALNLVAVAREYLGSLDRVTRIVRLGVSVATSGDVRDHRKSLTPLRSCCKTSSEKTRTLAAWCMVSRAFHSVLRWNWKSSLRSPHDKCLVDSEPAHGETWDRLSHHSRSARRAFIPKIDGSSLQLWRTRIVRCELLGAGGDKGSNRRNSLPYIETVRNELMGVDGRRRRANIG